MSDFRTPAALPFDKTTDVPNVKVRSRTTNSLMDVWCDAEPKVCKLSPKGYRLKIEDYLPIMAGETSAGIASILDVVLHLCRKRELFEGLGEFSAEATVDLEHDTAALLRYYLRTLEKTVDDPGLETLPLSEGKEA